MTAAANLTRPADGERCLPLLTALPGVSTVLDTVTTLGLDRVTRLLEGAAYLPLWLDLPVAGWAPSGVFRADGEARRLGLASRAGAGGVPVASNPLGGVAAHLASRWGLIPDDYDACPGASPPWRPALDPGRRQRFELPEFELTLAAGAGGLSAYGTGSTLPRAAMPGAALGVQPVLGVAAVLDVREGRGALAGLAGTVVISGSLEPSGHLRLSVLARVMDPAGGLPAAGAPAAEDEGGAVPSAVSSAVSYLAFAGEIDLDHRVTLRCSPTDGLLGSNVFERLRLVNLGFAIEGGAGGLAAWTVPGAIVGSVAAKLDFYPLSIPPVSPISTHQGVFEFEDPEGRPLGALHADMVEGRAMRTALPGELLPAFRFGGFGPITGGSGRFAGATGVMTMNSVVSVQPRTLANLYVLGLDDPEGRFRERWPGAGRAA